MEGESPEELQQRLNAYKDQLEQIDTVLEADPNNETLARLRLDIVQVIELTTELLGVTLSGGVGGGGVMGGMEEFAAAPKEFEAGDIVMALFEKELSFQAAEIDAVTSEGNFAITWLGYPSSSAEVPPSKIKPFEDIQFQPGDKVMGVYSGDSLWYEGTVSHIHEDGYTLVFDKFKNSERVPKTHLKPRAKEGGWAGGEKKRKLQMREVPENLKILPTDTDAVKAQKKKKIKSIKSHNRSVEKETLQNKRQNNWLSFQNKGAKRKVTGKFVGRQKDSMFKTPEGDTGKVGVIGSGRPMTEFANFEDRQRHRSLGAHAELDED